MRTKEFAATRELDNGDDDGPALGSIEVSLAAIAAIASKAALGCYGVVGTTGASFKDDLVRVLDDEDAEQGVEVRSSNDKLIVDVHVVIEYGTRTFEVAHNIIDAVSFAVKQALDGVQVRVNVHVEALRASDTSI